MSDGLLPLLHILVDVRDSLKFLSFLSFSLYIVMISKMYDTLPRSYSFLLNSQTKPIRLTISYVNRAKPRCLGRIYLEEWSDPYHSPWRRRGQGQPQAAAEEDLRLPKVRVDSQETRTDKSNIKRRNITSGVGLDDKELPFRF